MLVSEFIDRTGYQPTAEEYDEIQKAYYAFKGDKDAYCRAWVKANPHKAGTLWSKQKEQARVGKVFDRLVSHIIKYAKRKEYERGFTYYMNFCEQQAHADFVRYEVKAKNRRELFDVMQQLSKADAVRRGWSDMAWDYYFQLQKIV